MNANWVSFIRGLVVVIGTINFLYENYAPPNH